ncbi:MAG: phosphoribosyltransferase family protein [Candidatus Bathyarchaeia archaeon]
MAKMSHIQDLKFRLMTVDLLRLAKKRFTYRDLSKMVNLQITVLSRYVKGHVLPSTDRAIKIWSTLNPIVGLESELWRRVVFDEEGYFDNTGIIGNSTILQLVAQDALSRFAGVRINKVLTAAVDGIPIATAVAQAMDVDLIIAKKSKEVGVSEFVEESYILKDTGMVVPLYIPKNAIKRRESILIVDDIIRTGETQKALISLVHKCKAEVAGIYALVAIGENIEAKISPPPGCRVEIVLRIRPEQISKRSFENIGKQKRREGQTLSDDFTFDRNSSSSLRLGKPS